MKAFAPALLALALLPPTSSALPAQAATPAPPAATPAASDAAPEIERAARDLAEAKAAFDRDGGRLWGKSLAGPILLIDPESRRVLANQADTEGKLQVQGSVYTGQYPTGLPIANTAVDWASVHWAMVLLPLPEDPALRVELLAHESFHRVQESLGLPQRSATIAHLDGLDGRLLLRLEWRALRAALEADPAGKPEAQRSAQKAARAAAIHDALVFRARRRALFPAGAEDERALEMHEGLAEDTGCAIAAPSREERRKLALYFVTGGEKRRSFARSFAYASGPAYGFLLDELRPGWRKGLDAKNDLGALLAGAVEFAPPADLEAEALKRSSVYGGADLRAEEGEREKLRLERATASRKRFVEGPALVLSLHDPQVSFDPNALEPLEGLGTVYRTLELAETWGTLTVQGGGGALLANDWTKLTLPVPADPQARPLQGDGWTLTLKPGWRFEPGARTGDLVLVSQR